jgi:D-alanyl-D-alanine carboxypeptidase
MLASIVLAAIAATASPTAATPAPPPPPALMASSPEVQARLNAGLTPLAGNQPDHAPAMQVAIVEGGQIVYNQGFGTASTDTRFAIGSITKLFTAIAIMQLVQEKRVDLNAPVTKYLPDAKYAAKITITELMQHTSGLWNYGDYAFTSGAAAKPTTPNAILELAAGHPLTSLPGTTWAYSNTGYVALGLIVEHVSGMSLADYDAQHILQPAGMTQTTIGNPPAGVPMAKGYLAATGTPAPPYDPSWTFACGNIVSTAADLARFDIALMSGKLVTPETFTQMQTTVFPTDGYLQGLGPMMMDRAGMQSVGHHGGLPGFEANDQTIPSQGVAWVVLGNAFDFKTSSADKIVLNALWPQQFPIETTVATPEDKAITARFRTALMSFTKGSVDRSQYTADANAALTPDVLKQTATLLSSYGTIQKIEFVGIERSGTKTVYKYKVTYPGGHILTWEMGLDANDKIFAISGS